MITRHLWRSVDELIITPIEKPELQARVQILQGVDVELINFTWDQDVAAALASGNIQVISAATQKGLEAALKVADAAEGARGD